MYPHVCYCFLIFWLINSSASATEITPNDAFALAYRVNAEIAILKRFFKITDKIKVEEVQAALNPRHTWQRIYGVFYRLNVLRKNWNYR